MADLFQEPLTCFEDIYSGMLCSNKLLKHPETFDEIMGTLKNNTLFTYLHIFSPPEIGQKSAEDLC